MIYIIKLLGAAIVIISSTLGGLYFGQKVKIRYEELKDFYKGFMSLRNEINYTYTSLPEAFKKSGDRINSGVKCFFYDVYLELKDNNVASVEEAFTKSIMNRKNELKLKEDDYKVILDLSKGLGEWDVNGQDKVFEVVLKNLNYIIEETQEGLEKNIKMYKYLGLSLGLVITIIFI